MRSSPELSIQGPCLLPCWREIGGGQARKWPQFNGERMSSGCGPFLCCAFASPLRNIWGFTQGTFPLLCSQGGRRMKLCVPSPGPRKEIWLAALIPAAASLLPRIPRPQMVACPTASAVRSLSQGRVLEASSRRRAHRRPA